MLCTAEMTYEYELYSILLVYEAAGRDTGTTILVHNTGNTSILPVSSSICNTGTGTGKY
jgi:hypothetical protein